MFCILQILLLYKTSTVLIFYIKCAEACLRKRAIETEPFCARAFTKTDSSYNNSFISIFSTIFFLSNDMKSINGQPILMRIRVELLFTKI